MAKNISLILDRFKDVRTSILTLIFVDSPTFNNNGVQMYLGSYELSKLKLGKTHEEAEEFLEKVIPPPRPLPLTAESERRARKTCKENVHGALVSHCHIPLLSMIREEGTIFGRLLLKM